MNRTQPKQHKYYEFKSLDKQHLQMFYLKRRLTYAFSNRKEQNKKKPIQTLQMESHYKLTEDNEDCLFSFSSYIFSKDYYVIHLPVM